MSHVNLSVFRVFVALVKPHTSGWHISSPHVYCSVSLDTVCVDTLLSWSVYMCRLCVRNTHWTHFMIVSGSVSTCLFCCISNSSVGPLLIAIFNFLFDKSTSSVLFCLLLIYQSCRLYHTSGGLPDRPRGQVHDQAPSGPESDQPGCDWWLFTESNDHRLKFNIYLLSEI